MNTRAMRLLAFARGGHGIAAMLMLLAGLGVLPGPLAGGAAQAQDVAKVVYHADFKDPRRFSAMITSINNMVTTYKNQLREYDIRIVFNSYGIRFLTAEPLADTPFEADEALEERRQNLKGRLMSLHNIHDVKLELCDITRSEIGLSKDSLYEGVELVESGVVRAAELQDKGFAYIKIE